MQTLKPLTPDQQQLVEENIPLVFYVARRYDHIPTPTYEDLIGKLYYRLCQSVAAWQPTLGYQISSYLVKCLQCEAKNYFRDEIWTVRPPRRLRERPFNQLLEGADGGPGEAELQGENPEKVRTCLLPVALDACSYGQDEGYTPDILVDDPHIEEQVVSKIGGNELLREIFAALPLEERIILALKMRGKPLWEIQQRFGISRTLAGQVWNELQERVGRMYLAALEGRPLLPSSSRTLARILKNRIASLEKSM